MKQIMLLIVLGIFTSCLIPKTVKLEDLNITNSTKLARKQTLFLDKYKNNEKVPEKEIKKMEENLWVMAASVSARSNLVIRHWCLIDLLRGKAAHVAPVKKLLDALSGCGIGKGSRIWLEGYSYWLYTREIMDVWIEKFPEAKNAVLPIIREIDSGFVNSAYIRDTLWYPAPFGDLKAYPLTQELQQFCNSIKYEPQNAVTAVVKLEVTDSCLIYKIKGSPLGLNFHIPKENSKVIVKMGYPINYKFYTSYQEKYSSKKEEYKDLLDKRRVNSIKKCP